MSTRAAAAAAAAGAAEAAPAAEAHLGGSSARLPRFNGTSTTNFVAWLYSVENLTFSLPPPERTRAIISCFEGAALETLMLSVPPAAFAAPWEHVRPVVLGAFVRQEHPWERDQRFASRLVWTGAGMHQYIAAFSAEVAFSQPAVTEQDRLRYFLGGLSSQPAMQMMIARAAPRNHGRPCCGTSIRPDGHGDPQPCATSRGGAHQPRLERQRRSPPSG